MPFLKVLVIISLLVTVLILVAGIYVNSKGGALNRKYGNKLMRLRVYAQAITLILFAFALLNR